MVSTTASSINLLYILLNNWFLTNLNLLLGNIL